MDSSNGSNITLKSGKWEANHTSGSDVSLRGSPPSSPAPNSTVAVSPPQNTEKVRRVSVPLYTISTIHNNTNISARTRRLSGNYNAEVWKKIFGDIDPSSVIQFDNEDAEEWEPQSSSETSDNLIYSEELLGLPSTKSGDIPTTISSIQPAAITLSTPDFKSGSSQNVEDVANPPPPTKIQRIRGCVTCSPPTEAEKYAKLKTKFSKSSSFVDKFYKRLAIEFEEMEVELEFDSSVHYPLGQELSVIAAQMWFLSLALSKQLEQRIRFDPETEKKLLQSFQSIISDSIRIARCVPRIEKLVREYELEGLIDGVEHMKKSFTGKSDTDLTQERIVDEVFASSNVVSASNCKAGTSLKSCRSTRSRHAHQRKTSLAEQLGVFDVLHQHENCDHTDLFSMDFSQPDTLRDRKKLEIYVRNVTKVGWISFEQKFPKEKIFQVENEFLLQIKNSFKFLAKTLSRILRNLDYGAASQQSTVKRTLRRLGPCAFPESCLPWISGMKKQIDLIVNSDKYCTDDYEFLRLRILSAEMQLEKIIAQGTAIIQKVSELTSIVVLCCDFLSHVHKFHLTNYGKLRSQMILEPKGSTTTPKRTPAISKSLVSRSKTDNADGNPKRRLSRRPSRRSHGGQEEKLDDADFYLSEYAMLLKTVPVSFGLMEYILVNKIDVREQHSGVNFDGPRYFNVCQ